MSTLKELNERLTIVENNLFVPGHFRGAEAECKSILNHREAQGDQDLKSCTVCLCIQAMFEQKKSAEEIDKFVMDQYDSMVKAPYDVFNVWFQHKIYLGDLKSASEQGIEYLAHHKRRLEQNKYDHLIYHLVFRCLTRPGEARRALKFIKRNTFLSPDRKKQFTKQLHKILKRSSSKNKLDQESPASPLGSDIQPPSTKPEEDKETKAVIRPDDEMHDEDSSTWNRLVKKLSRILKRLKEVAPLVFLLVFVTILLALVKNMVSTIRLARLKAEARKFFSLFFALDPMSGS
ncbi:hypothetical protein AAMO2058_000566000 [Amorphochlora amoebiformis]